MRCLVVAKMSNWDVVLAHTKFAYTISMNRSMEKINFDMVVRMLPKRLTELKEVIGEEKWIVEVGKFSSFMKSLHEEVKLMLEQSNQKCNKNFDHDFDVSDEAMVHFKRGRFLVRK